ncbi:GNAT family N-acetyltransferase [Rhodobacter ferrooxidans]|uniref:Protein involved in cellulose biosynthesis-like protein n=1 Tax=Rhodobacter ferrooxidans TaxID=371731 RepID=C8S493_9RHOB|nr:GNAT family N-acetyltransferase [Rhodobacter sp. SW2]EEW24152.1 Protein involved in cellulose biosynthesis-like protein [Rhodobacter sp. SW2]
MIQSSPVSVLSLNTALAQPLPAALNGPVSDARWLGLWAAAFCAAEPVALVSRGTFLPLCREMRGPMAGAQVLRGMTNGQSQYTPAALDPTATDRAAQDILKALKRMAGWDFLHLQGLPESVAAALEQAALALGLRPVTEHVFANLETDLAAIRAGTRTYPLRGETRRRKDRQLRALQREGEVSFVRATEGQLPEAMRAYLAAEQRSWKARAGEVLADGGALEQFYHGLAQLPGVEIWLLRLQEEVIAGVILRRGGGTLVALKCLYDQRFHKFSPAILLLHRVLQYALGDPDLARIDWYSDKDSYRIFSTDACARRDLVIWSDGMRPTFLRHSRQMLQWIRAASRAGKAT